MATCNHPDCPRPATHWVVRHLASGYLPNPDARAYCDAHRVVDLREVAAATRAPVLSVELVEVERVEV